MAAPMRTGSPAQAGFTLLGLLFVIAGLGVAMAALGTSWHTAAQREKERELLFIGDQFRRAIESFWKMPLPEGTPRRLPRSVDELLEDPRFPHAVRHLRRAWRDPVTGDPEWGLLKDADGGLLGVYSLSDVEPFKRDGFPPIYMHFVDAQTLREWVFRIDPAQDAQKPPAGGGVPKPVNGSAPQGAISPE